MKMFYQFALFAILAVYSSAFRLDLDFMTSDDLERYFNVKTLEEVPEYEIVDPIAYSAGGRHRRQIEIKVPSKEIKLWAFGEEFHMKLEENTQLLARGLQVDVHNADGTVTQLPLTTKNCFYHGELLSHEVSTVAVSTCDGLTGMIATATHDLFISPLSEEHKEAYRRRRRDVENPHVIYRRTPPQEGEMDESPFCGLDPEMSPFEAEMHHSTMERMHEMQLSLAPPPQQVQHDETSMTDNNGNVDNSPEVENTEDDSDDETVGEDEEDKGRRGEGGRGGGVGDGRGSGPGGKGRASDDSDSDGSSRKRRQTNGATKYLEVRVLADAAMMTYHGNEGVIPYTLTLMNIVAARYMEPSLGRTIIIHIVKIGYLNSDTVTERNPNNGGSVSFTVRLDGPRTLNDWSYFAWQTNPYYDSQSGHWDNAVLITRKNIQVNGSPNLLGIAWGNATCYLPRAASVNQDQGLSSGIVVSHEMGHTLGLGHDNDNGCQNGVNVMSSHRPNGAGSFKWSDCSRNDLNSFLSYRDKQCLNDQPSGLLQNQPDASNKPGSVTTADEQCILQSTTGFNPVTYTGSCTSNLANICTNLFCYATSRGCSSSVAAAEGTYCGTGKWCISGECVTNTGSNPPPNNDIYEWRQDSFGPCSVTCGNGVQVQIYRCFSVSANQFVADSQCTATKPTSQSRQCFPRNCPVVNSWALYSEGQCSVTCGTGIQVQVYRCFNSANQIVDDSQCTATKPTSQSRQCFPITCPVVNNWSILPGPCSTSCGQGTRTDVITCVNSSGQQRPDSECDLSSKPSPSTTTCSDAECSQAYWFPDSFSQCSVTCGNGIQTRTVFCVINNGQGGLTQAADHQCDQRTKPATQQTCTASTACPSTPRYTWFRTEIYSECTATCGSGTQSTQVICIDNLNNYFVTVDPSYCDSIPGNTKPEVLTRPCQGLPSCPSSASWQAGSFSSCSVTCGQGIQQRTVSCITTSTYGNVQVSESLCDPNTKPSETQLCNLGACPTIPAGEWATTSFSECSVTCGQGTQQATAYCRSITTQLPIDISECDQSNRPSATRTCNPRACPSANNPDQGVQCAGLWTRPVSNLNRFSISTGGQLCKETFVAQPGQKIKFTFHRCVITDPTNPYPAILRDYHEHDTFSCDGHLDQNGNEFEWVSKSHVVQMEHPGEVNEGYIITVEFVGQPTNGCDQVHTAPSGLVTSPQFPSNYRNNQRCQTAIIAPPGKRVQMTFETIQLHRRGRYCSRYPNDDNFEIYDLDTGDGFWYCGMDNNPAGEDQPDHENRVLVQFLSNNGGVSQGFAISYVFVDA